MSNIEEWKENLDAQGRKNVEALVASLKDDWVHYYAYVSEETGWTRAEIIAHLLRFDIQTLHKGMAAHGDKVAPLIDKATEELAADDEWR